MYAHLAFRRLLVFAVAALMAASSASAQQPAEVTSDAQVRDTAIAPAAGGQDVGHTAQATGHGPDAAHGHAAHIGAENVSAAPEEFKADLAIYSFVVFLLLVAILTKFAWGPISAGLDQREQRIANQIAAAEKANADARLILAEYQRKLAASADEVRAIIDEARRDAEHTQQEILAKARADAQVERDRALREIDTATNQALKQLAEQSANLAVELAGKILRAQITPGDHTRLIEESTAKFLHAAPSKN